MTDYTKTGNLLNDATDHSDLFARFIRVATSLEGYAAKPECKSATVPEVKLEDAK